MKTSVIFLICLCVALATFGQIETTPIEEVKVTPPKFTGIEKAVTYFKADRSSQIDRYLAENFICPVEVNEWHLEGTEVVQFTVNPDGTLSNFNVLNSVCHEVDNEMIRILQTTNRMWLPGSNNEEPVAMEQEASMMIGDYSSEEIVNHFIKQAEKYFTLGSTSLLVDHKPKKALRYLNKSKRYTPNDKGLLLMRGICNYEIGDKVSARNDWDRIVSLGGVKDGIMLTELSDMKGYSDMTAILAKKDN